MQQEEDIEDAEGAVHTAVYIMTRSALVNNSENEKRVLVSSLQNVQYLGDRNIKRILTLSGLISYFRKPDPKSIFCVHLRFTTGPHSKMFVPFLL